MYNNDVTTAAALHDMRRLLKDPNHKISSEVVIANMIGAMEACAEKNDLKDMRRIKDEVMDQELFRTFNKDDQTMLKACYTYHYRLIQWRLELIRKSKE